LDDAHGRDRCLEIVRSTFEASPELRLQSEEVLAADGRVVVTRTAWRGRGVKASELEVEVGAVQLVENGRWTGVDIYEPGDHAAMIARYAELGGGQGPLGDSPPEQFYRRWLPLSAAGDLDRLAELMHEDFVRIDHRSLSWDPIHGREANLELYRAAYGSAVDIRIEIDEVLACGDRVIAVCFTRWSVASDGGGEAALSVGQVNVIEDGRWRSCDQFAPDDREAMLARFNELSSQQASLPAA
jgi:ketosteroid isomerase-like protein